MASDFRQIYRVWMGYISAVNVLIPEDLEVIDASCRPVHLNPELQTLQIVLGSSENMEKSRMYEPLLPWLKTGLLTSSGKKWHTRRKILTPAFHLNILQQFVKVFGKQTRQFLEELDERCDQPFLDLMPLITDFALRSICGETAKLYRSTSPNNSSRNCNGSSTGREGRNPDAV